MSEKKLEEIMSKDKSLVRRVSDIEVEEVTLTKKGALGDEADAVILYKEGEDEKEDVVEEPAAELEKEDTAELVKEESTEEVAEEVAELEKEEVVEDVKEDVSEMDFDSAISFIAKEDLSDTQKQTVLDTALELFGETELAKDAEPAPEASSDEVVSLLKEILEKVSPAETSEEIKEEVELAKEDESEVVTEGEVSTIDKVEQLLLKSRMDKAAQGRAEREVELNKKLNEMSSVLSGLTEKFTETQRRLSRECGIDA